MTLSLACLPACSPQPPVDPGPSGSALAPAPGAAPLSLHTPIKTIAANTAGHAILERDTPGVLENSNYPMFSDMTLPQIAVLSSGRLTSAELAHVQADLAQLNQPPP